MKNIKKRIAFTILMVSLASCGEKSTHENVQNKQSFTEHAATLHHQIALEVLEASKSWIGNFNKGNAEACVKGYDAKAVMSAAPFGVKKGVAEISEFWLPFIQSGAANLIYTNVSVEVANETTAFLSANWSMNVGKGAIYQEKWEKIEGRWLLTYDDFKVMQQFETPKENMTKPVASHVVLEDMITASMEWIEDFNSGNSDACGNRYSENASMNAVPFESVQGKEDIKVFWNKMVADGAKNLIYHNTKFTAITEKSAVLSSNWSMNMGEGKIYQEKWEYINNKWLLVYDEFQVLKQY